MVARGAAVVCLVVLGPGAARAEDGEHAGCAMPNIGYIPRTILERPTRLKEGVGVVRDPVTTRSDEAQRFYDQGVAYLHAFVWIEAVRSFRQALRLDPKLAMAHVGLSYADSNIDDLSAAHAELAEAQALAAAVSDAERARIEIRARQLEAIEDLGNTEKQAAYKKAIDNALAANMKDAELWLLRGIAEEPTAAGRGQRGRALSVAFYERALSLVPDHPAAHHLLVHSFENLGQVEDALRHGEAYARLAYAVPHAHHMYGHDLRRAGRTQEAIAAFKRTDALELAYYESEGVPAEYDWHHQHNLDLLAASYQYLGQVAAAEDLQRRAFKTPPISESAEYRRHTLPQFLLQRGRSAEALREVAPLLRGKWPSSRAIGNVIAGQAELALGRAADARRSLEAAEAALSEMPVLGGIQYPRSMVAPFAEVLRAAILLRSDKAAEGRALLTEQEAKLRALTGPDAWIQTLFQLEGIFRTARAAGDWDLAAHTAQQMLEHDPAYAGTHLALALVARHKGERAVVDHELAVAERGWAAADAGFTELTDVRSARQSPLP
jgi:tetratricopeptide (TPR) repeat protein